MIVVNDILTTDWFKFSPYNVTSGLTTPPHSQEKFLSAVLPQPKQYHLKRYRL